MGGRLNTNQKISDKKIIAPAGGNQEKATILEAEKRRGEAESDGHRKESTQARGGEGTTASLSSFIPRSPQARQVSFTSSVTAYT